MAGAIMIAPLHAAGTFDGSMPHLLAGITKVDGTPASCRIVVRRRRTGKYVISTVSENDGTFTLRHLPAQSADDPYTVTCFPLGTAAYNAQAADQVRQVNDNGEPPTTSFEG